MISSSFEEPLPFGKRIKIRMHYWICVWCRRYEQQLRLLREVIHRHPCVDEPASGPALSADARERMKAALRASEE